MALGSAELQAAFTLSRPARRKPAPTLQDFQPSPAPVVPDDVVWSGGVVLLWIFFLSHVCSLNDLGDGQMLPCPHFTHKEGILGGNLAPNLRLFPWTVWTRRFRIAQSSFSLDPFLLTSYRKGLVCVRVHFHGKMFSCPICCTKSWDTRNQKVIQAESQWGFPCDLAMVLSFPLLHCLIFVVMEEGPLLRCLTCT